MSSTEDQNTDRLEALAGIAQGVDAEHPTPEQQAQAQAEAAQQAQESQRQSAAEVGAREWGLIMFSVGNVITMIAPELKLVYAEDRCLTWGQAMHAVAEKHGWNVPSHSPELALLTVSAGFVIPTVAVLPGKIREARKAANSPIGRIVAWWQRRRGRAPAPTEQEQANGGQQ